MKIGLGQDSHRFDLREKEKKCILGGVVFDGVPPTSANSDGDVVLHAITNALSGITCRNILGEVADAMVAEGITDSAEYVKTALKDLHEKGLAVTHVSISIEALQPKIAPRREEMRASIGALLGIAPDEVGITATSGENLTASGNGLGISVLCVLTAE